MDVYFLYKLATIFESSVSFDEYIGELNNYELQDSEKLSIVEYISQLKEIYIKCSETEIDLEFEELDYETVESDFIKIQENLNKYDDIVNSYGEMRVVIAKLISVIKDESLLDTTVKFLTVMRQYIDENMDVINSDFDAIDKSVIEDFSSEQKRLELKIKELEDLKSEIQLSQQTEEQEYQVQNALEVKKVERAEKAKERAKEIPREKKDLIALKARQRYIKNKQAELLRFKIRYLKNKQEILKRQKESQAYLNNILKRKEKRNEYKDSFKLLLNELKRSGFKGLLGKHNIKEIGLEYKQQLSNVFGNKVDTIIEDSYRYLKSF